MAVKVLDSITLDKYNLSLTNLILSFKGSYRVNCVVENGIRKYTLSGTLYYFSDRNKNPLHYENIDYQIDEARLNTNLMQLLYVILKNNYKNFQDI